MYDPAHLGNEAHIQHAVSFINHQDFDQIQVQIASLVEVEQATRGGHQDIDVVLFERAGLFLVVHTADNHNRVQVGVARQCLGVLVDLDSQLARGSDDHSARLAKKALVRGRCGQQLLDEGNQKGGCLAGACLGLAYGILSLQAGTQYLGLNRCAVAEAECRNGFEKRGGQIKLVEADLLGLFLRGLLRGCLSRRACGGLGGVPGRIHGPCCV